MKARSGVLEKQVRRYETPVSSAEENRTEAGHAQVERVAETDALS